LDFQVRDYECDLQGLVNNAVYQNYLEHARHEYLKQVGLDFADLAARNIHLVVVRAELQYRSPLRSGDQFWVGLNFTRTSKLRFVFEQDIYLHPEDRVVLNAKITGTALDARGRPKLPAELESVL
jgi:acyl-CoA thioester hydrolase